MMTYIKQVTHKVDNYNNCNTYIHSKPEVTSNLKANY